MNKQKRLITEICLLFCFIFLGISVHAFWKTAGKAYNAITLGSYDVKLEEQYTVPDSVYPGMSVDKQVQVKNYGTVDAIVRIRFDKAFGNRSEDGVFQKDDALDSELIVITCNDRYWHEKDGYWYYSEVLKAGEQTKAPLFESFLVSELADNRYKGKDAEITVYMDSIQAEADALILWNTTREELNIDYKVQEADIETGVIFHGADDGFSFQGTEKDLFANFKHLVPGCSRIQKINIKNESEKAVELYLYAEVTKQDHMSEAEKQMIERILTKDARIVIRKENEVLYEGPVNGNPERKKNSMGEHNRIDLGRFSPAGEENLIVELSLSPELDHSFASLTGRVNWVFCAEGEEIKNTSSVPKTGDSTPLIMMTLICMMSILIFFLLVFRLLKVLKGS